MKTKKRTKFGLVARIILIGVLPLLIDIPILTAMSITSLETGMESETKAGLANVATLLGEALENAYEGEITVGADGKLYKGELDLESLYGTMDGLKEERDVELTVFYGDTRMLTTLKNEDGSRNVGTQADEAVVAKVMNGETYFSDDLQIAGKDYYVYYMPLHNEDGSVCGMIFSGVLSENVDSTILGSVKKIVSVSIVLFVVAVILITVIGKSMSKAVDSISVGLEELAEGNLNVVFSEKAFKRTDEIGGIARSAGTLRDTLKQMITEITQEVGGINRYAGDLNDMSVQVNQSTGEVSRAIEDVAGGANSQAMETENASNHVNDVSYMIDGIVDNITALSNSSDEMDKSGADATRILAELNDSNRKTTDAIKRITKQTEETNESVKAISQAAEVITSIAEETNLLALNASIEAARAGEHGKGFAVVADSIQKLAEQSNGSAREIMEVISALIQESDRTLETMQEVNAIVEEEGERVEETKQIIGRVTEEINSSLVEISAVKEKSEAIKDASGQINMVIQSLSAISQENAAATQETNASVEELNAMMEELSREATELHSAADHVTELMSQFKM